MITHDINNIEAHIGGKIRKRRHILGMSQTDLANKIKASVTFQQIQKYEKGQNKIAASRLLEISKIMNVSINYFFEGFKNKPSDTELALNEESAEFLYKLPEAFDQGALKLVKIYNKISNDKAKKKLLLFLKTLADDNE